MSRRFVRFGSFIMFAVSLCAPAAMRGGMHVGLQLQDGPRSVAWLTERPRRLFRYVE